MLLFWQRVLWPPACLRPLEATEWVVLVAPAEGEMVADMADITVAGKAAALVAATETSRAADSLAPMAAWAAAVTEAVFPQKSLPSSTEWQAFPHDFQASAAVSTPCLFIRIFL
ncbi:hypothetical protein HC62_01470 [Acetobacter tropicalis]|uniref:Uncharacterized protein n=1 Tax=Acetobacter tropicalis TaxID=104102 RepID=A0A252ABX2_9PROT|nr:hypothetical protein HC62_01470 [Acetobacter tropicalis]